MKHILSTLMAIILISSCSPNKSKDIVIHTSAVRRINPNFQDINDGEFYSIKIDLINNTDSIFKFWTMTCSWESNWVFDNKSLKFFVECPKNYPVIKIVKPHKRIEYDGIIELIDSTNINRHNDFKIGFVLVKTTEVIKESEVIETLRNKIHENKDIIWSGPLNLSK